MFPLSMTELEGGRGGGCHSLFRVTLRLPPGSVCGQDSLLGPIPPQGTQFGAETRPSSPSIQGCATRWSRRSQDRPLPSRRSAFLCKSSEKRTRRRAAPGRRSDQDWTQRAVLNQIP